MRRPPRLPWQGHSTNLVGASTAFLADVAFNRSSRRLTISGVREMNGPLFEMLGRAESLVEAREAFSTYMTAMFGIDAEQRERRAGRARFLIVSPADQGMGYDSNSPEGAVLKGWVESRFGIPPLFHKTPIRRIGQRLDDLCRGKMSSRFHDNSIYAPARSALRILPVGVPAIRCAGMRAPHALSWRERA